MPRKHCNRGGCDQGLHNGVHDQSRPDKGNRSGVQQVRVVCCGVFHHHPAPPPQPCSPYAPALSPPPRPHPPCAPEAQEERKHGAQDVAQRCGHGEIQSLLEPKITGTLDPYPCHGYGGPNLGPQWPDQHRSPNWGSLAIVQAMESTMAIILSNNSYIGS